MKQKMMKNFKINLRKDHANQKNPMAVELPTQPNLIN